MKGRGGGCAFACGTNGTYESAAAFVPSQLIEATPGDVNFGHKSIWARLDQLNSVETMRNWPFMAKTDSPAREVLSHNGQGVVVNRLASIVKRCHAKQIRNCRAITVTALERNSGLQSRKKFLNLVGKNRTLGFHNDTIGAGVFHKPLAGYE